MTKSLRRPLRGPTVVEVSVQHSRANDNDIERDERSVTVAIAATQLGCDSTTVRELLRKGLLTGHRVGKSDAPKGVRIKLWSIRSYEERHAIGSVPEDHITAAPPPSVRRAKNKADDEADARLTAIGA